MRTFNAKVAAARALFAALGDAPSLASLARLDALSDAFALSGAACLARGRAGTADFLRAVAAGDFPAEVDRLVAAAELRRIPRHLRRLRDVYPARADLGVARVPFEACAVCGGATLADPVRSELRCADAACGATSELVGTVFEDSQFYCQEGQKAKSGTFNPNRHFQYWWQHLLALEPDAELASAADPDGSQLIAALRAIVARDGAILRCLTVADVRGMLRELGRSELNRNVPLILKKLTGVGPPAVPEGVAARVENLFSKAIEIAERVRCGGRVNRNYYPYYIFKIYCAVVPPADREARRLLYYIHVQGADTIVSDDADWERVCAELREIPYEPTDRTLGLSYPPPI